MMARHKTLSDSGADRTLDIAGPTVFGRDEESEQLRKHFAARHSFLFYGPAGVGKTLLLRLVAGIY